MVNKIMVNVKFFWYCFGSKKGGEPCRFVLK